MKKLLVTLLTAAMTVSMAACGGSNTATSESTPATTESNVVETTESTVETESAVTESAVTEGETVGQTVFAKYNEIIAATPEATAQEIVDAIVAAEILPFMPVTMPVEPGFLMGFDADVTGFKEAVQFSPMIGTIPFMGFIFTLEADADVEAFTKTLEESANPAWNICTQADEIIIQADGTTVFFLMGPNVLE